MGVHELPSQNGKFGTYVTLTKHFCQNIFVKTFLSYQAQLRKTSSGIRFYYPVFCISSECRNLLYKFSGNTVNCRAVKLLTGTYFK